MALPASVGRWLLCISGLFCIYAILALRSTSSFKSGHGGRSPVYSGSYGSEAYINLTRFRSAVYRDLEQTLALRKNRESKGRQYYDLYNTFLECPPGMPLTRFGRPMQEKPPEDGGKSLCTLDHLMSPSYPCVVYSFGSNGDFQFETDILAKTSCLVYTFDCTYDGASLGSRHVFEKICLGSPLHAQTYTNVMTYQQITEKYGHRNVEVAKIDIEGFEYDVLGWLGEEDDLILPQQLSVELHQDARLSSPPEYLIPRNPGRLPAVGPKSMPLSSLRGGQRDTDMALLFLHLANLGYGIVYKEVNPFNKCCMEYVFLRVEVVNRAVPMSRSLKNVGEIQKTSYYYSTGTVDRTVD